MDTKTFLGTVKAVGGEGDPWDIEVIASTDTIDRSDEVIHQDGWDLGGFKRNPVFIAAHTQRLDSGHSPVIGSFIDIGVGKDGLAGRIKFADTELGREYKALYRDKHMRAVSVGFVPKEQGRQVDADGQTRTHYTKSELLEVSAVAVPANPDALALGYGGPEISREDVEEIRCIIVDLFGAMMERADEIMLCMGEGVPDDVREAVANRVFGDTDPKGAIRAKLFVPGSERGLGRPGFPKELADAIDRLAVKVDERLDQAVTAMIDAGLIRQADLDGEDDIDEDEEAGLTGHEDDIDGSHSDNAATGRSHSGPGSHEMAAAAERAENGTGLVRTAAARLRAAAAK